MKTAMQDTSIAAYHGLPVKTLKTQSDRICEIVERYHGWLGGNISLKEIQSIHRRNYGDIELSTVSARVNGLVAAKRLERLEGTRKCSVTGVNIHPLKPVEKLQ
ncbi:hypothetical protein SAMN05216404_106183 [Nitrosospira multiformis]|uniref:Uncharacterized protein n=1 Tax=Nitrosospira multiformis TaxID=1231 RepID=A0A1H8IT21_9PROT|nr:hypothetical protein [Nitrosospira multiformis]SEN72000.1 hypothetical protein SAMN05216404_106183 [Nitrosospira multiformis]